MGVGQLKKSNKIEQGYNKANIITTRFMHFDEGHKLINNSQGIVKIDPFKRLMGWQLELQGVQAQTIQSSLLQNKIYFEDQQSLNTYIGHMVALKQICHLNLYDDFQIKIQNVPIYIATRQQLAGIPKQVKKTDIKESIQKFINLLIFLSQILQKSQNIYITPADLLYQNSQFYLIGFSYKQISRKKLIMAYIVWLYEQYQTFQQSVNVQNTISSFNTLHRYIKQIFYTIKNDRINDNELVTYFKNTYQKIKNLDGGFDSFHACYRAKRSKYNTSIQKEWLLAKKYNQIYFVNIEDGHVCQGRVMRKNKKINIQNTHLMFNASDFQVCFMLEGTKNMVKTTEFELDDCFTISDIQIKYKFPFKIRNPFMFWRGREIYVLDQIVHRYSIDENKIYQQSKKINDSLCLVQSAQLNYLVIRHSIDIFRYGIRIYVSDRYQTLMPSGSREMAALMENIKVDIKHVDFCIEVFKGIFFMMADKNLWVLDLNFMCFFSYAPLQRVYNYYKGKGSEVQNGDFVFQILNQPFAMSWVHNQQQLNVHIEDDVLHIIANVTGKLFYLQYKFIFEAGLLRLIKYKPLYSQQPKDTIIQPQNTKYKESYFNVYNQSMQIYKTTNWIYKGSIFLEVTKLKMAVFKNHSQIFVQTDIIVTNLKDVIQENNKMKHKWSKFEVVLLLYKLWTIIQFLNQNGISYKNLNLANLCISSKREIKLLGWSQPQRNWHISDYKDYLLASFNIVTQNNYEKLNDKFLQKHEAEIKPFPILIQKMQQSIRSKTPQKKTEVDKNLIAIKQCLHSQIYNFIQSYKSDKFIFSFQHNTPRFSMLSINQLKIKKMIAIIQSNNHHDQFTFKQTDQYAWSNKDSCLYVMTSTYQMYQIKINVEDLKEETLTIEEYEYLPSNIIDCSFISCNQGLFAFGGVSRNSKKKVHYNQNVYHFNREKLTWQSVAQLNSAKIKPKLVLSEQGTQIYIMDGDLDIGSEYLQTFVFDLHSRKVEKMIDLGIANPFKKITEKHIFKIFQISQKYKIFLVWSVNSMSYQFKIFSCLIAGFQIDLQGKIYLEEGADLPSISIGFSQGALHFIRPYGKYSKITIEGLQNPKLSNKTLYAN